MTKRFNLQVYQDLSQIEGFEDELNPIYRALNLSETSSGLNVDSDSAMMGFYECPFEIAQWIDTAVLYPIESGELTLKQLQKLSDNEEDLGEYNLKLFFREVIEKNGEVVDNFTAERKKRNIES